MNGYVRLGHNDLQKKPKLFSNNKAFFSQSLDSHFQLHSYNTLPTDTPTRKSARMIVRSQILSPELF